MDGFPRGEVRGDGVVLREPREGDEEGLIEAASDPLTQRYASPLPAPYTRADAQWYLLTRVPKEWERGDAVFAITEPGVDRFLGIVNVRAVSWSTDRTGQIGYFLSRSARGRGLAIAAARALTDWAFGHGVGRLELRTVPENVASQRVALAAGYRREGIMRGGGVARDGTRVDDVLLARLASDPPRPTPRLLPDLPGGALSDGVVTLRPVEPGDADDAYRLRCLPEVVRTWVPPRPPERAEIDQACRNAASHWLAGSRADLTIRDAASGAYAGQIDLSSVDASVGEAMIGYAVLPEYRGRGFATRAARLLVHWAFDEAHIPRLFAGTRPDNPGSQRVLERVGFRREGVERGLLPTPDGGRVDNVLYGLLPGDLSVSG